MSNFRWSKSTMTAWISPERFRLCEACGIDSVVYKERVTRERERERQRDRPLLFAHSGSHPFTIRECDVHLSLRLLRNHESRMVGYLVPPVSLG